MLVYQRVVPLTNSVRFNNLVNFLAPDEYFIDRTGELIGVSSVVDVMIRGGEAWLRAIIQPGCKRFQIPR